MSPADNMPDFDKMTPEEITAWMETLAERQGATEGFTSENRMEIADIDPNEYQETGPGYIPYGMSEEEWAKRQAKEEGEKAARLAAKAAEKAATTPPPAPIPEPVAEAAPAASAGGMPDFDNMTQEEMIAWMEQLAVRQDDTVEGLTVKDNQMAIPDVAHIEDQDTGPGYIPYGMSEEEWARKQAKEQEEKAARRAAREAGKAAPPPEPAPEMPVLDLSSVADATPPPPGKPQFELPQLDDVEEEDDSIPTELTPASEGAGMDWLGDLMPDQANTFPEVDLSGLDQIDFGDLDTGAGLDFGDLDDAGAGLDFGDFNLEQFAADEPEAAEGSTDPMDWLDNIAKAPEVNNAPTQEVSSPTLDAPLPEGITDPTQSDVDPLEWLESLAQQEGASSDEFITAADVHVPPSPNSQPEDTYTDYTVESEEKLPVIEDAIDALDSSAEDDPAAWLDSLASAVGTGGKADSILQEFDADDDEEEEEAPPETEDVMAMLSQGISDPKNMEQWMKDMLEKGAARSDIPDYIDMDDDETPAPAIEAHIPDWLIDQVGTPPDLTQETAAVGMEAEPEEPEDDDEDALAPAEMPDWLADQMTGGAASGSEPQTAIEDLFAEDADDDEAVLEDTPDWLAEDSTDDDEAALQPEMPDWLQDSAPTSDEEEAIFVSEDPAPVPEPEAPTPAAEPVAEPVASIDSSDPWVKGFEIEQQQGLTDPNMVPDWYAEKLGIEPTEAPVPAAPVPTAPVPLAAAALPAETTLPAGELEMLPAWLSEAMPPEPAAPSIPTPVTPVAPEPEPTPAADMPEWLKTAEMVESVAMTDDVMPDWLAGLDLADDVPDWLLETVHEDKDVSGSAAELPPVPQLEKPFTAPPPPKVAPPAPPPADDVLAALASAREKFAAGDMDGALADYESVVRANAAIDEVIGDLAKHIEKKEHKGHAPIYRVLGDAYMRQGQLQVALDTYRKALNLL